MHIIKKNIFELNLDELKAFFREAGEKEFRAKQVYEWLWQKGARDFDMMSNLSKNTRKILLDVFFIPQTRIEHYQQSQDKTMKFAFKLHDGFFIEGVLIPTASRTTACISSQVGCPLSCAFCATAKLGYKRNLGFFEIFDQVKLINEWSEKEFSKPLSNIVLMGMGEPLLNYNAVKQAILFMTGKPGMEMSPSRITLSTVGIVEGINQMAAEKVKFNLAISLHTANEKKRNAIVPANKTNSLKKLATAIENFHQSTGTRITYEYLLMKDFNDSLKDAEELAEFCRITPCKVNIIEYNQAEGLEFKRSTKERTNQFVEFLEGKNMVVNLRRSRGQDIDAACGQLANNI